MSEPHQLRRYLPSLETIRRAADPDAADEDLRRTFENPRLRDAIADLGDSADRWTPPPPVANVMLVAPSLRVLDVVPTGLVVIPARRAMRARRQTIVHACLGALSILAPVALVLLLGSRRPAHRDGVEASLPSMALSQPPAAVVTGISSAPPPQPAMGPTRPSAGPASSAAQPTKERAARTVASGRVAPPPPPGPAAQAPQPDTTDIW